MFWIIRELDIDSGEWEIYDTIDQSECTESMVSEFVEGLNEFWEGSFVYEYSLGGGQNDN